MLAYDSLVAVATPTKKDRDEITIAKSIFDEIVEETECEDEITMARSVFDEIVEETENEKAENANSQLFLQP